MAVATETPDQLLERLDLMGLDRVKVLQSKHHFEPKARGLVQGWIDRKEEALKPPPVPTPEVESRPDPLVLEARRAAQKALTEARAAGEAAAAARRLALVAAGLGGAGLVVAILALFATALN